MSSAKQGMIWSAVNTWTNNVLSLAVVTLLARLVSPNEFGLVALAGIYVAFGQVFISDTCLLYTSPSPRDGLLSRMPSSA